MVKQAKFWRLSDNAGLLLLRVFKLDNHSTERIIQQNTSLSRIYYIILFNECVMRSAETRHYKSTFLKIRGDDVDVGQGAPGSLFTRIINFNDFPERKLVCGQSE